MAFLIRPSTYNRKLIKGVIFFLHKLVNYPGGIYADLCLFAALVLVVEKATTKLWGSGSHLKQGYGASLLCSGGKCTYTILSSLLSLSSVH